MDYTVTLPKLLTVDEAADYLGIAPQVLYDWRYRGKGPSAIKVGGSLRYKAADLAEWIGESAADESSGIQSED